MPANGRWDLIRRLKNKVTDAEDLLFQIEGGGASNSPQVLLRYRLT